MFPMFGLNQHERENYLPGHKINLIARFAKGE